MIFFEKLFLYFLDKEERKDMRLILHYIIYLFIITLSSTKSILSNSDRIGIFGIYQILGRESYRVIFFY